MNALWVAALAPTAGASFLGGDIPFQEMFGGFRQKVASGDNNCNVYN